MEKSQENGLTKGPWSIEEDQKLIDCIKKNGQGNWKAIAKKAGLNRCGKSCRLRWTNYLNPAIRRGGFSDDEEATIIALHKKLGNKWSIIAAHLPRRTDNEIKNYWNTHLRKKLLRMGIDPATHVPIPPHHDLNNVLNLPYQVNQLFTASNLYNYLNVPNLDGALLGLPPITANDLIKIQILQNMLQLVNPTPLPYNNHGNTNSGDHFTQINRNYNEMINNDPTGDSFQAHSSSIISDLRAVSASLLNPVQQTSTSNSVPCFEIESITPVPIMDDRNTVFNSEFSFESLPSLVTVTPDSSTVNKLGNSKPSYINTNCPDNDQLQTNQFEAWETLNVNDEANSSLWEDIFG